MYLPFVATLALCRGDFTHFLLSFFLKGGKGNNMDQKKIGLFLKELRKEKELTQSQLAEQLNVSDRTVSRWETGTNLPDLSVLVELADFYDVDIEDLIVIYDDLDLPHGKIRMRLKGSAGGHNGIKSLIAHTKTQEFKRIRVGIDRHPKIPVVDYVLGKFTEDELALVNQAIDLSVKACEMALTESFNKVMTEYSK